MYKQLTSSIKSAYVNCSRVVSSDHAKKIKFGSLKICIRYFINKI